MANYNIQPKTGRPKGSMNKATKDQKMAARVYKERTIKNIAKLFNAQLHLATGEQALYVRRSTGKGKNRKTTIERVTDEETIKQYLDDDGATLNNESDDDWYFISKQPANNQAIDSLLNRLLGKPKENIKLETDDIFKDMSLRIEVVSENPNRNKDYIESEASPSPGTSE